VAACLISEAAGVVTWSDFRDFTGVYVEPVPHVPQPEGGTRLPLAEIRFAADQYRAEVTRAAADLGWEMPRRRAARVVRARLALMGEELATRGYRLGWVGPSSDPGLTVELRLGADGAGGQVGVRLPWEPGMADEAAAELAAAILRQPEESWDLAFRNVWRR
jgi:hypothetical protein